MEDILGQLRNFPLGNIYQVNKRAPSFQVQQPPLRSASLRLHRIQRHVFATRDSPTRVREEVLHDIRISFDDIGMQHCVFYERGSGGEGLDEFVLRERRGERVEEAKPNEFHIVFLTRRFLGSLVLRLDTMCAVQNWPKVRLCLVRYKFSTPGDDPCCLIALYICLLSLFERALTYF